MREHVINVQLRITARDSTTRADLMHDLREQLAMIQEQAPYRNSDGAQWWTNSPDAVVMLKYDSTGEQMEAEAEMAAEADLAADG